ncbi:MAG: hypothetical protein JW910_10325 [Anaerolineae bacterium]|nr:hypothetical protein [Anaerolineae bacterium]
MWLLFLFCFCALHAPAADAARQPDAPLVVAWANADGLFAWHEDAPDPRQIAGGSMDQPVLSPDGALVAIVRDASSLWVSDTLGTADRRIVEASVLAGGGETRRVNQIIWSADSSVVYFNTLLGEDISMRPADDLWRVDVQSGVVERLLEDGVGGMVTPGPDGTVLALASAGTYQDWPGAIAFYTPATGQRDVTLEFPAVATASEWRWHPDLCWKPDGSGVLAAIPPVDLVYGGAGLDTALWWLPVDGEAAQIGQTAADFFGLPTFSAEGEWIAYIAQREALDQTTLTLMIARVDGSEAMPYATGAIGALVPAQWLPVGERFVFGQDAPGMLWIGQPGVPPVRFVNEGLPASAITWADATTYVFSTFSGETFVLYTGTLDDPASLRQIAEMSAYPLFDAVRP